MSAPRELPVLYRDRHLLVVDKPAGLLVHRGWADDADTALARARSIAGSWVYPAHRLDRATSGVLVFALDAETAGRLGEAFRALSPRKEYLGLVRGRPAESGYIDSPVPKSEHGERVPAQTRYRCLGTSSVERCSLVRVWPESGRLHQIRRHMKHISHPLIGDVRYGKGPINRHFRERFGLQRTALHASAIEFAHPHGGERLCVRAPLAADLVACFRELGFSPELWGDAQPEPSLSLEREPGFLPRNERPALTR